MDLPRAILDVYFEKTMWERRVAFLSLAERYRKDSDFRSRLDAGDTAETLEEIGFSVPPGVGARFTADTPDTLPVVMPVDPNTEVSDEALSDLSAGGKTAGCGGASCNSSSVSSAGSNGPPPPPPWSGAPPPPAWTQE